jgi:hypothetical protein
MFEKYNTHNSYRRKSDDMTISSPGFTLLHIFSQHRNPRLPTAALSVEIKEKKKERHRNECK